MKTLIKAAIRIIIAFMIFEVSVQLIGSVVSFIGSFSEPFGSPWYIYSIAVMVYLVLIIILALFWIYADRIVRFIAGPIRGNEITINTSNADLLAVVLSVFGVYLIVNAITGLAGLYAYHWQWEGLGNMLVSGGDTASEVRWLVTYALSLLIGLVLVLGNKGIKRLWQKFNDSGKVEEPEEDTTGQTPP